MDNRSFNGIKLAANAEARWFADLVGSGRLLPEEAREAIAVPDDVLSVWAEAGEWDEELRAVLEEAATFRQLVGEKFEALLTNPLKQVRQAKIIKRGEKREVRLPVAPEGIALANTPAQEPRSLEISL